MKIDKSTRIYIAGSGGMLGEAVYHQFSRVATVKATDVDVNEPWLSYGDVRDHKECRKIVEDFQPHAIINLAALTDLEYCERNQENAWLTNALGAENLGLLASERDIPYIYISTAGIFGGEKDSYTDFDIPNPLCIYAKSKYFGECWVQRAVPKHYVVRAGWMMGGGVRKDKKFINKVYQQLAAGKRVLHVVDDKAGTPTYTVDFARGLQVLLESDLFGLYNQVCEGDGTRYDVAVELVKVLGLENQVKIEKVSSDFFQAEYFAQRPASERLVNTKLNARGLNVMRDWRVSLREYLATFPSLLAKTEA